MAKKVLVPVSARALLQRINRKLASEGQKMCTVRRGSRWGAELGDYYVIDVNRNSVEAKHVSPEQWGRELGCLAEYEKLAD